MTRRHYADTAPTLTISGSITSSATSCVVTPAPVGWPASFPFFATLELGTANVEDVLVTNVVGSTLTITRGQNGTTAVAHGSGASIDHTYTATDMDEANAHVNATSGVHGIAGSVVGTTDVQTLTNKTLSGPTVTGTLAVTNETVSGTLSVTGTTTLGTVNTGAATASSVTSTGAISAASLSVSGTSTFTGAATHNGALNASGAGTGLAVTNNATVGGTLAVTGAATSASCTATGAVSGKTVVGALVATSFTNEAAATTALPSPAAGTTVYLTAPTTGLFAGRYSWNGSAWVYSGDDTGWTTPTLGASWVAFGAPWASARYCRINGVVYIGGMIKNGTSGTTIFTLPAGLRPANTERFMTDAGNAGFAVVDIASTGAVQVTGYGASGTNGSVSMAGISFRAEA